MSRTEELIAKSQLGDREAADILVRENAGLIWSVAKRFSGRSVEAEDLYQLGCLGFLKAVNGFDISYGTQFSTYAVPKIAGEIRRFLRDDGTVKVSRTIKEQAYTIKTARNLLLQALGREPTLSELARHTGFTIEEIAEAEVATSGVESINQTVWEDGFALESVLTDSDSEDAMLEKLSLRQGIKCLPERERLVISLRYFHGLTQQRVSMLLNVSQVQVSRIEKKAINLLKEYLI